MLSKVNRNIFEHPKNSLPAQPHDRSLKDHLQSMLSQPNLGSKAKIKNSFLLGRQSVLEPSVDLEKLTGRVKQDTLERLGKAGAPPSTLSQKKFLKLQNSPRVDGKEKQTLFTIRKHSQLVSQSGWKRSGR